MKKEDHSFITEKALELYSDFSLPNADTFTQFTSAVVLGSEEADIRPYSVRATNWHFFKANELLQPHKVELINLLPLITIYRTSEQVLRRRIIELETEISKGHSEQLFELVGRILHHVQDMSTPSHVVPVYHGPLINDEFETYCHKKLDKKFKKIVIKEKDVIYKDSYELMDTYVWAAKETLAYLRSTDSKFEAIVDGKPKKIGWDYFWRPYDGSSNNKGILRGFGSFSTLAKHFGDGTIDIEEGKFELDCIHYENLLAYIAEKTLKDSLQVLQSIGRKLQL
jgi:hypothetical protein